jgi:hypothetical protein
LAFIDDVLEHAWIVEDFLRKASLAWLALAY